MIYIYRDYDEMIPLEGPERENFQKWITTTYGKWRDDPTQPWNIHSDKIREWRIANPFPKRVMISNNSKMADAVSEYYQNYDAFYRSLPKTTFPTMELFITEELPKYGYTPFKNYEEFSY